MISVLIQIIGLTTFWSIDHVTNWLQYFLPECNAVELRGGAVSEDLLDLEVWPRVEEDGRVVALLGHGEHRLVGVNLGGEDSLQVDRAGISWVCTDVYHCLLVVA